MRLKLTDICRPKQWKTISMNQLLNEGYPVYGANGKIGFYSEYTHEKPTLLITCRGATCGTVNISEPFSYINGNAMALDNIDISQTDIHFLYYCFLSRGFRDVISGSAQPQITRQGLEKVVVDLPEIKIQKQIVQTLDTADTLRQKRKEQLNLLDDYHKSVFFEMFGDPVRNEKEYQITPIRKVVTDVKYGTSKKANANNGKFPILRMNNITYSGEWYLADLKYIDLTTNEIEKYTVKKWDLLFNRTNSKELVGKTAVFNSDQVMAYAGYLIRCRFDKKKANPVYVSCFLNSSYGKSKLSHMCKNIVGMANINAQELQDINIILPPIYLQNKFASIVEQVEQTKQKMRASLEEMDNHFNALMQRYFG